MGDIEGVKIDLGCGPKKKEGFIGIDQYKFDGVDIVCQLGREPLPFDNDSVSEVNTTHFIEHLTAEERVQLFNELYRIMKVDAKIFMVVPYWGSSRAYGDPTHKWPPIGEMWFYYLDKKWRDVNAPHVDGTYDATHGYTCNFTSTWGYNLHRDILVKNEEFKMFACTFYKEAIQDIAATMVKVV